MSSKSRRKRIADGKPDYGPQKKWKDKVNNSRMIESPRSPYGQAVATTPKPPVNFENVLEEYDRQEDDDQLDSVFSMPNTSSDGHYSNKSFKPDPNDPDSWQKEKEPKTADIRPARVIKKLMEFYATDVQWEFIRCSECNKVLGQRQQRIELVQVGGNAVVYCLPDLIRCLACRDKHKGKGHGKEIKEEQRQESERDYQEGVGEEER